MGGPGEVSKVSRAHTTGNVGTISTVSGESQSGCWGGGGAVGLWVLAVWDCPGEVVPCRDGESSVEDSGPGRGCGAEVKVGLSWDRDQGTVVRGFPKKEGGGQGRAGVPGAWDPRREDTDPVGMPVLCAPC